MGVQVDLLTKGKQPYQVEFIDFEFNGRKISEFGLVAVSSGDRLQFPHSSAVENETSEVAGYDGQYFWGTRFKSFTRTFNLATDGMDEQQWNDFKSHFAPGRYGKFNEFHLAARESYCRVQDATNLSIVPFKENKEIFGQQIDINIYKGSCSLTFEWDEPYTYAIKNIITEDDWDASPQSCAREMYTNNTPRHDSWVRDNYCCIGDDEHSLTNGSVIKDIEIEANTFNYYNPSITKSNCRVILTLKHSLNSSNLQDMLYFNTIGDSINGELYNTIRIYNAEDEKTVLTEMRYSSPDVIYQINRAIQLGYQYYNNNTVNNIIDFEELLREEITNPKVMGWAANAIRSLSYKADENGIPQIGRYAKLVEGKFTGELDKDVTSSIYINLPNLQKDEEEVKWVKYFNIYMLTMLAKYDASEPREGLDPSTINLLDAKWALSWEDNNFIIEMDSQKALATVSYNYNQIIENLENKTVSEENCGNIMCSDYLKLDGGDSLILDGDQAGKIKSYHIIKLNKNQGNYEMDSSLKSVQLFYRYTYL